MSLRRNLSAEHGWALRLLKPVRKEIPDLGVTARVSFEDNLFEFTEELPDLSINSQPLNFMLSNTFGLQTLGVSGRFRLHDGLSNWLRHRILLTMLNAGLGLASHRMLSRRQLAFFWARRSGLIGEVRYRIVSDMRGSRPT